MKRVIAWFAGLVGIAALGRWLTRRSQSSGHTPTLAPAEPEAPADGVVPDEDPADELRRRLADARATGTVAAEPPPAEETLEERRQRVHAEARATIDTMTDGGGSQ